MRPTRKSDIFDAVAHPVRRQILVLLKKGARPAGELAAPFSISLAAVAQHLAVLRQAELVTSARSGRNIIYLLSPRPLRELYEWADGFAGFWNAKLDALEAHLDANPDVPAAKKSLTAGRSARASTVPKPRIRRGRTR